VQSGLEPEDWKAMRAAGSGVREICVRDESGVFRVIYLATLPGAIYVLHAFQKKTQRTARSDIDLARSRFRQITRGKNA
jgi:phage-related protein